MSLFLKVRDIMAFDKFHYFLYSAMIYVLLLATPVGCPVRCHNLAISNPIVTQTGHYWPDGSGSACRDSSPLKPIWSTAIVVVPAINIISAEAGNSGSCNGSSQTSIPEVMNYCEKQWGSTQDNTWQFNPDGLEFQFVRGQLDLGRMVGYKGDPYIPDRCTDIDECKLPDLHPCNGNCTNTEGSYECICPHGKEGDGKAGIRARTSKKFPYTAGVAISCLLGVTFFLGLCFMVLTCQQRKRYQIYYQMMEGHLRVFSKRKIKFATNNFDESRILGTGGHGKVYMGRLKENKDVAIKISKEVEESQIAEFVNEILLLSRINHKNIVRLIGCCIEVKVPILVYEFVPNGTLHDLLHGKGKNRPISLDTRIKIALDSAEALNYLHYSIDPSILHGDFKSANILLEGDYRAKVSDFGASNLVPTDETHVIVEIGQGTRGYIDPEYYATGVLTKKTDVYSFGVVLLELITRKYAIFRNETSDIKHLASCFVSTSSNDKLHEMLDKDIVTNNEKVLETLQELAMLCVSVRGEDRPTMKEVMEKLQILASIQSSVTGVPVISEEPESLFSESMYFTTTDTTFDSAGHSSVLEMETHVDEVHPAS